MTNDDQRWWFVLPVNVVEDDLQDGFFILRCDYDWRWDRRCSLDQLVFSLELKHDNRRDDVGDQFLMSFWWCCTEGKYQLLSELPYTSDGSREDVVWSSSNYQIILIDHDHITIETLLKITAHRSHRDVVVDSIDLIESLAWEMIMRFDDDNLLAKFAEVLGDQGLHPSLARASWWDHDLEWVVVWDRNTSYCCLIRWMLVLSHIIAHILAHLHQVGELEWLLDHRCLLLIEVGNSIMWQDGRSKPLQIVRLGGDDLPLRRIGLKTVGDSAVTQRSKCLEDTRQLRNWHLDQVDLVEELDEETSLWQHRHQVIHVRTRVRVDDHLGKDHGTDGDHVCCLAFPIVEQSLPKILVREHSHLNDSLGGISFKN